MDIEREDASSDNFQQQVDSLPSDTAPVLPTNDDDSDVKDVEFGDPKLMFGKGDPTVTPDEAKTIIEFIRSYPYSPLTYLCRRHNWKPSDAAAKVMAFEPNNDWWDDEEFASCLKADSDSLTAKKWEPGVAPVKALTKGQVFQLFNQVMEVRFDSSWDVYDMMHRMCLDPEELGAYFVDYCVSRVLSRMKYVGGDQKWLFSLETIKNAALNNSWINGWPTRNGVTPYCHYCPGCGTFFTGTEASCTSCGASRCLKPKYPIRVPGKDLEDLS